MILRADHTVREFRFPLQASVYLRCASHCVFAEQKAILLTRGGLDALFVKLHVLQRLHSALCRKQITANAGQFRNHFIQNKCNDCLPIQRRLSGRQNWLLIDLSVIIT